MLSSTKPTRRSNVKSLSEKCERCQVNGIDVEMADASNPGTIGVLDGTTKCEECGALVCDQDCVCKEYGVCKTCCAKSGEPHGH